MTYSVSLLGALRVLGETGPVKPGGAKERALLAVLALNAGRVVSLPTLIDALWGNEPPETAQNALQVYVSRLRRLLGRDTIRTGAVGYQLDLPPEQVDALRFEQLSAVGRAALARGETRRAADALRAALDLWTGAALADCRATPSLAAAAIRLEELRLVTLEDWFQAELDQGAHSELVPELGTLVEQHPFRERLRVALLLALHRSGRVAEALEAFDRTRRLWIDELGLEPGPELQRVHRAILAEDPTIAAPARSTATFSPPPAPPTAIVGRARDLRELSERLAEPEIRLVTAVGPGGVGKTRLALELARHAEERFPDGVCWVPLAQLDRPGLVLRSIAQAVGLREPSESALLERVCGALRRRRLLLVLDNFEHLMPARTVVADLLAGATGLTVLVTSRAALRLAGEYRYRVAPLAVPEEPHAGTAEIMATPAAALFWDRATAVCPGLALRSDDATAIAKLCAKLDGLPLAIELAAARANVLRPADLLVRLDRRLSVLTTGSADSLERHRSLRATMQWSHGLLAPAEREMLARLAVFRGGWTLAAAEAVADPRWSHDAAPPEPAEAVWDRLAALVDASLVTQVRDDSGTRFSMLETVREYAAEQLAASGQEDVVRTAHARYFAGLASAAWTSTPLLPPDATAVRLLDAERDNLRDAIAWAGSRGEREVLADLVCSVAGYWTHLGLVTEMDEALAMVEADPPSAGRHVDALHWRAYLSWLRGDALGAVEVTRTARELAEGDPPRLALASAMLAFYLALVGANAQARSVGLAALEPARRACGPLMLPFVLNFVGCSVMDTDFDLGTTLLREAAARAEAVGDEAVQAMAANNLAEAALGAGDAATALSWAECGLRLPTVRSNVHDRAFLLDMMASALLVNGDLARAALVLGEAVRLAEQSGDMILCAEIAVLRAVLAVGRGDERRAVVLLAASDENLRRAGEVRCGSGQFLVEKFLGDPGRRLAPEELAAAHTEGARLDAPALYRYLREDDDLVPAGETHAAALNSSRRSAAASSRT